MAVSFPYTYVTGQLKPFLEKVRQVGRPAVADVKWLASIGFNSPKAGTLLGILKVVGLTDSSGRPTDRWLAYRDNLNGRKALAQGVMEGYADLFETYSDAPKRSEDELRSYFQSKTGAGPDPINKMVLTFRALSDQSDFSNAQKQQSPSTVSESSEAPGESGVPNPPLTISHTASAGVTININIQLALPESNDEKVYDSFFAAMKKHLLS